MPKLGDGVTSLAKKLLLNSALDNAVQMEHESGVVMMEITSMTSTEMTRDRVYRIMNLPVDGRGDVLVQQKKDTIDIRMDEKLSFSAGILSKTTDTTATVSEKLLSPLLTGKRDLNETNKQTLYFFITKRMSYYERIDGTVRLSEEATQTLRGGLDAFYATYGDTLVSRVEKGKDCVFFLSFNLDTSIASVEETTMKVNKELNGKMHAPGVDDIVELDGMDKYDYRGVSNAVCSLYAHGVKAAETFMPDTSNLNALINSACSFMRFEQNMNTSESVEDPILSCEMAPYSSVLIHQTQNAPLDRTTLMTAISEPVYLKQQLIKLEDYIAQSKDLIEDIDDALMQAKYFNNPFNVLYNLIVVNHPTRCEELINPCHSARTEVRNIIHQLEESKRKIIADSCLGGEDELAKYRDKLDILNLKIIALPKKYHDIVHRPYEKLVHSEGVMFMHNVFGVPLKKEVLNNTITEIDSDEKDDEKDDEKSHDGGTWCGCFFGQPKSKEKVVPDKREYKSVLENK